MSRGRGGEGGVTPAMIALTFTYSRRNCRYSDGLPSYDVVFGNDRRKFSRFGDGRDHILMRFAGCVSDADGMYFNWPRPGTVTVGESAEEDGDELMRVDEEEKVVELVEQEVAEEIAEQFEGVGEEGGLVTGSLEGPGSMRE